MVDEDDGAERILTTAEVLKLFDEVEEDYIPLLVELLERAYPTEVEVQKWVRADDARELTLILRPL
jgi:hypothetical protein